MPSRLNGPRPPDRYWIRDEVVTGEGWTVVSEWSILSMGSVAVLGGWSFLRVISKEVRRRERVQNILQRRALMEIRLKRLSEPPVDVHPPEEITTAHEGKEPAAVDGDEDGA